MMNNSVIERENTYLLKSLLGHFDSIDELYDKDMIPTLCNKFYTMILAHLLGAAHCIAMLKNNSYEINKIICNEDQKDLEEFQSILTEHPEQINPVQLKIFICETMPHIKYYVRRNIQ